MACTFARHSVHCQSVYARTFAAIWLQQRLNTVPRSLIFPLHVNVVLQPGYALQASTTSWAGTEGRSRLRVLPASRSRQEGAHWASWVT